MLPDFSRPDIKYEDVRRKNVSTVSPSTYKTDPELIGVGAGPLYRPSTSSKVDAKKRANSNYGTGSVFVPAKHQFNARGHANSEKREREKKPVERKELKTMMAKNEEPKTKTKVTMPVISAPATVVPTTTPVMPAKSKETTRNTVVVPVKEESTTPSPSLVPEMNQNLLREWVSLSDSQLVDTKTLESTLQSDFVNGFDINASAIQSQLQDIINSESSLSTNILMGGQELPSYIQVEGLFVKISKCHSTRERYSEFYNFL